MTIKNLLPKFPNLKYVSIGDGDERANLEKLKKASELKVSEQFNLKSDPIGNLILNLKIDRNSMWFYELNQE